MAEDREDKPPGIMRPELLSRFGRSRRRPSERNEAENSEDGSPLLTRRALLAAAAGGFTALALRKLTSPPDTPLSPEAQLSLEKIRQEKEDIKQIQDLLGDQLILTNDPEFMKEFKKILEDSDYQAEKSNGLLEYSRDPTNPQFYRDNPQFSDRSYCEVVDFRIFLAGNTGSENPRAVKIPNLLFGMFVEKGTNRVVDWDVRLIVDENGKIRRDDITSDRINGYSDIMDDQVLGNLESLVFKNPTNSSVFPDASGYLRFRASGQLDSPGKIAFYRGDSSGSLEYTVEEN